MPPPAGPRTTTRPTERLALDLAASAGLDFDVIDQVPEQQFDGILWRYVHGPRSTPPPPGPNASSGTGVGADADADAIPSRFLPLLRRWLAR